ncbi:MAG: serine/threonine protein kinase, partial [Myxococcales bacterium]|nr:serine/threonine protein kinase [Myxococcales bacterium]
MSADRQLLERFLRGELDAEAIDALERRLDEEPELQRELGALAQEAYEAELPDLGTTRMSLFQGRAFAAEPIAAGVELREVIGRGGMGVVHRGLQHSLGRTVAVKSVRDPERHRAPLLQEAVLTGYLEHPNIAPVHEITTGADGQPLVVLKHIEGTVWSDTLPRPNQPSAMPLEWHLRVVLQICQALRFAHSRGVVHRDVKPSNVMIGEFDEVYLMDWGLGVCLDAGSRLPSLADQRGIAGTPAFMAPEQLEEDPSGIGTHTDVYLVGACLYHLATGEPPQAGTKLAEIREAVKARRGLSLPAETPPELAGIIERAMALAPTDRYASIGDLRDALEGFLEHRTSETLVARGDERAEAMMEAHGASDAEAAERAFFDAAFNYRAALDSWPNNEGAQQKLDALVRARVEQLISLDAPLAARRALAIVEAADSEL